VGHTAVHQSAHRVACHCQVGVLGSWFREPIPGISSADDQKLSSDAQHLAQFSVMDLSLDLSLDPRKVISHGCVVQPCAPLPNIDDAESDD